MPSDFLRDDVVFALAKALDMTEESAAAWFDNARDNFSINIEGLATLIQQVPRYQAGRPSHHLPGR